MELSRQTLTTGQYVLRRLALMVPASAGILLINFAVVQFTRRRAGVEQMLYRLAIMTTTT